MRGWPFFELEVRTPRLTLRVPTDETLERLADVAVKGTYGPGPLPFQRPWMIGDPDSIRLRLFQSIWLDRSDLAPDAWRLAFAVEVDGDPIGVQTLIGDHFPLRRVVRTASWLGLAHQGQGIGKEMRAAALHLAFVGLGAARAESEAHEDNLSSIGVTAALGYRDNGSNIGRRARVVDEEVAGQEVVGMRLFVLDRSAWEGRRRDDIELVGVEPCLPLLGLATERHPAPTNGAIIRR